MNSNVVEYNSPTSQASIDIAAKDTTAFTRATLETANYLVSRQSANVVSIADNSDYYPSMNFSIEFSPAALISFNSSYFP